ncbi:MAG: hypothetical protein IH831_08010, partial [Planctomycetes bacterium]|nr:hypothetical protein [Planctomycetota bacterium]
ARLWDLSSEYHSESIVLGGHKGAIRAIAASPDSRWLVTGGDGRTLRVWDLKTADPSAESRVLSPTPGDIHSIAISRDNRWLAVGGVAGRIHLWSMSEQGPCELPVTIDTGNDHLNAMAFSPDSQWLATAGSERSVRLWNMNIDLMLLQAAKIATNSEPSPWPQTFSEILRITRFFNTRALGWSQLAEGDASQKQSKSLSDGRETRAQHRSRAAQHAERGRPVPQTWEQAAMDYTLGGGRSGSFAMFLTRMHPADPILSESAAVIRTDSFNPLRFVDGNSSRTEMTFPITARRHFKVNEMRSK